MINKTIKSRIIFIFGLLSLMAITMMACGGSGSSDPITDITWQWVRLEASQPEAQAEVTGPEFYTITFLADGEVSIKADCNMVLGAYSQNEGKLSIELGPSTMAYCGEQSRDLQFLRFLENAESFSVEGRELVIELRGDAGKMFFQGG